MDTKEIMQADLLDILFEHRNKDYGAYELRRGYNRRLLISLSSLGALFLICLLMTGPASSDENNKPIVRITDVFTVQDEMRIIPELPPPVRTEALPPAAPITEAVLTSRVRIVEQVDPANRMANQASLVNAIPSHRNFTGMAPPVIPTMPVMPRLPANTGNGHETPPANFVPDEIEASFPGGPEALTQYMASNLVTPDDLQPGEKRTVHVRFTIGADGKTQDFEIVQSAGYVYDEEVLRVCRRMPKWKPARQNGVYVTASFLLPVSFVGLE